MTGFKPGDRVQHHTGVEGTVTRSNGKFATVDWDHHVRANTHHVDLLTPLGEPMSKRTDFLGADGSPMTIEGRADHENWAIKFASTYREFTPADAPVLALAILEAAGHKGASSSSCLMQAFDLIEQHIKEEAAKAKEAAGQEALEGEALALFNSTRPDHRQIGEWGNAYPMNKKRYTEVALKARELYGVKA